MLAASPNSDNHWPSRPRSMDKSSSHRPRAGSLQVDDLLSPPLTPDPSGNNAMGIMNGSRNTFQGARPISPDPSVSSSSISSPVRRPDSAGQPTISFQDLSSEDAHQEHEHEHEHEHDHDHITKHQIRAHSAERAPSPSVDDDHQHQHQHHTKPRRLYSDGREDAAFPRLSKPVELLRGSYDVVVIGSGYGGGVAASRMARTGESVCLLERGKERWPGEYPSGAIDAVKELHCSGNLAPGSLKGIGVEGGDPTGMFHLVLGRGQSALVGNGECFFPFVSSCSVLYPFG